GSDAGEPRFRNHGDYVNRFTRQVNELQREGFLLEDDAEALKERAAESDVGKPGSCET
ncbi:MAG: alpha/beta hydrolase domain-containing protein, partial [Longimicrobiales bacterium]